MDAQEEQASFLCLRCGEKQTTAREKYCDRCKDKNYLLTIQEVNLGKEGGKHEIHLTNRSQLKVIRPKIPKNVRFNLIRRGKAWMPNGKNAKLKLVLKPL